MKQKAIEQDKQLIFSDLAIKAQVAPHTASGLSVAHLALDSSLWLW